MKYMGSKARHAKEILPILMAARSGEQTYVEPFVGGANMLDKVAGNRIGADINEYLISMWQAVCIGWEPPDHITRDEYILVRDNIHNYPKHLVGWVAHCCAYNGKWFGGYAGRITTKEGGKRDYQIEAKRAVLKQAKALQGATFLHSSYDLLEIPAQSVLYCDPPYKGTTQYKDDFDHDKFYSWCRKMRDGGHVVFVSEYDMPDDFECVWSKDVTSSLTLNTGSKRAVEKLFRLL